MELLPTPHVERVRYLTHDGVHVLADILSVETSTLDLCTVPTTCHRND